jgi:ribosomal protein L21E
MAKKKASGGPEPGTRIRVKPSVNSPDFPEISFEGWTGAIVETSGKAPDLKLTIEWDQATVDAMPANYLQRCEAQQLYHLMACLAADQVDLLV